MDSTEQVFETALSLPPDDRAELAELLISSLQPDDQPPFDESWREVIQRRSAELRSGKVTPIPWEEVTRKAREKVGG